MGKKNKSGTSTPSSKHLSPSVSTELQRQHEDSFIRAQSRTILNLTRTSNRTLSSEDRTISAVTIDSNLQGTNESTTASHAQRAVSQRAAKAGGAVPARGEDFNQVAKLDDIGADAPPRPTRREVTRSADVDSRTTSREVSRDSRDNYSDDDSESTSPPQFPGAERVAPGGRIASYSSLMQDSSHPTSNAEISVVAVKEEGGTVTAMAVSREELEEEVRQKLMAQVVTAEAVVEIDPNEKANPSSKGNHTKEENMEQGTLQAISEEPREDSSKVQKYQRRLRLMAILLVVVVIIATVATVVAVTQGNKNNKGATGNNQNGPKPNKGNNDGRRGD